MIIHPGRLSTNHPGRLSTNSRSGPASILWSTPRSRDKLPSIPTTVATFNSKGGVSSHDSTRSSRRSRWTSARSLDQVDRAARSLLERRAWLSNERRSLMFRFAPWTAKSLDPGFPWHKIRVTSDSSRRGVAGLWRPRFAIGCESGPSLAPRCIVRRPTPHRHGFATDRLIPEDNAPQPRRASRSSTILRWGEVRWPRSPESWFPLIGRLSIPRRSIRLPDSPADAARR
jgi:hypothetical protein